VQQVVWKILPDVASAALALQAGDVDLITTVSLPSIRQLAAGPGTKVSETPTLGWNYIFVNTRTHPFDNVHRRRAVQYAIDRRAIVDAVVLGHGVPMLGPLPPNSWAYDASVTAHGLYGPRADLKKAAQELAAAHSPSGFAFTLTYPTLDPFTGVAQAVKAQLAAAGISANLDGREIGTVLDNMFVSKFQALNIDWSGRIDEDLSTAAFYETKGANNFEQYSNSTVDMLLQQAGRITDRAKRAALYHRAQVLINADAPIILLFFPTEAVGLRSRLEGFQNLGDQRIPLYNVWLSP
jgi:ABC-type transport system substrate-binding protein